MAFTIDLANADLNNPGGLHWLWFATNPKREAIRKKYRDRHVAERNAKRNKVEANITKLRVLGFTLEEARKFLAYDPDQPRVPAGDPAGGQWVGEGDGGGSSQAAGGYGSASHERFQKAIGEALADKAGQKAMEERISEAMKKFGVTKYELASWQLPGRDDVIASVEIPDGLMTVSVPVALAAVNLSIYSGVEEIIAHEAEHQKFNDVLKKLDGETDALGIGKRSMPGFGKLPADEQAKYPIAKTLIPYDNRVDEMVEAGGVSEYSNKFFPTRKEIVEGDYNVKGAMWRTKGTQFNAAVHETLAEVSRLKQLPNSKAEIAPVWRDLHNDIESLYKGAAK